MTEPPPADPDEPAACYGLGADRGSMHCPRRQDCERFELLGTADGWVIATCQRGAEWPLFRARVE